MNGLIHYSDKVDAIGFSDDYGEQRNLLISPEMWRKIFKPHLKRMYELIRKGGKYVYLHSCGNISSIIPDLIELGVNIIQPIQPEAMDIFRLKKEYGKYLCLMGGIGTQHSLFMGNAGEIYKEVRLCLEHMPRGGGYVMAPSKPIMPGVPLENAVALIDAIVRQT